jgi:hypothetical protein
MKKVEPFFYKDDGTLVINMDSTELDADWLRAARLQEKADRGDVEAARELERMANTPMYEMTGLVDAFNELVEKEKEELHKQSLLNFEKLDWSDTRMTWEDSWSGKIGQWHKSVK